MSEELISRLHFELIRGLIQTHACPTNSQLAGELDIPIAKVEALLRELAAIHGVVLHPHICEPWVIHPFSITPTPNWIEGKKSGWWAPCLWCAFGVAELVGGETRIHSRIGGESEAVTIMVRDGIPVDPVEMWVHFAIPPAQAWQNVHQHCSMVLPFRSPGDIAPWCERHGLPHGEAIPLLQVAELARLWYGSHADPGWQKWSVAQAQEIFHRAGLRSEFWELELKAQRF